ncbi:MAG: ThiF family adenylyltransferase [Acidobacteriota bacterium]
MDTFSQADRYSRQILFPGIGEEGQLRLARSRVSIIGCGALGSLQAEMLARAGVGFLRLIDRDFVEQSNLHRQVLYDESDAAEHLPKAVAAARRLSQINSTTAIESRVTDVSYSNVEDLIGDADVVLDGTDNFETRFLINDAAVKLGKPWVYGAAVSAHGVQMTIRPHASPCLRCIFPEMPAPGSTPTCDTAGVILPIIATIVSFQVAETLKLLTDQIAELHSSLIQIDLWSNVWTRPRLAAVGNADCPVCAEAQYDYLNSRGGQFATALCGRNAVQISPGKEARIDFEQLSRKLQNAGKVEFNQYLLRLVTDGYEITVFADARGIIKGTDDPNLARSLYARYIGA